MAEYIEREAALNFEVDSVLLVPSAFQPFMDGMAFYAEHIKRLPAADVRPVVRGKWERHFSRPCVYADMFWHCSVCGYKNAESFANSYHHYCPNCGADMRGAE